MKEVIKKNIHSRAVQLRISRLLLCLKQAGKENFIKQQSATISFEIIKQLGVLSENAKGWKKEINLISWNGNEPKSDIREWDQRHERMTRGITLSTAEMNNLLLHMREHR